MAACLDGLPSFNAPDQLAAFGRDTALDNDGRLPSPDLVEFSQRRLYPDELELLRHGFPSTAVNDACADLLKLASSRREFARLLAEQPVLPEDRASLKALKTALAKPKSH